MTLEAKLIQLEGRIAALIDITSSKQVDYVDGEAVKKFVDNYAFVNAIISNDSITSFLDNVSLTKKRFDAVSGRIDGLLAAAEAESNKLIAQVSSGSSGIALNVADITLFQTSVADAYKSMLSHLADIDITGKISRMESSLSESLGLIEDMRSQRTEINELLQKVASNKALIDNQESVNTNQALLIDNTQNLIVELEKQIENYAFYSEEFDKVYVASTNFIGQFAALASSMEYVTSRDNKLVLLMESVVDLTAQDFAEMETHIKTITTSVDLLATSTAQKLNDMLLFSAEFNAIGTATSSVRARMQDIKNQATFTKAQLDTTTFIY